MFRKMKKMLSLTLSSAILASTLLPTTIKATEKEHNLVILHTNDLNGAIEEQLGYAGLAAYKEQWEMEVGEEHVLLIDSGNALTGSELAEITEGQAIVDIMNGVGFDYFVPSVGEFSYELPHSLFLMDQLSATVLSSNFVNETQEEPAYASYDMLEYDDTKIAIVGITAPVELLISEEKEEDSEEEMDSYTLIAEKEELYEVVQAAVDDATKEGAELIIAVGNFDTKDSDVITSIDVIENTTGISLFLGGYAENEEENKEIENKDGDMVILQQGGSEFNPVGEIIIDLETLEVTTGWVDETFEDKDDHIQVLLTHFKKEFLGYEEEVVSSESGAKTLDLEKELEEELEEVVIVSVKGVVTKGEPIVEEVKTETNLVETKVPATEEVVEEPVKTDVVTTTENSENSKSTEELLSEIDEILQEVDTALGKSENATETESKEDVDEEESEEVDAEETEEAAEETDAEETEEVDEEETEEVDEIDDVEEADTDKKATEEVEESKDAEKTDVEKEDVKTADKEVEYVEYVVKAGDTLSHIALEYLGNGNLWNDIHVANSDTVSNPHLIFVGQVIMVPANVA